MGLSAVAWMVSQLGGWVRHRPGDELGGACFEIRLPAVLPPQEAEPEAG
jgi:C4-dicarboxylate-specific signal transduction histidine kinase